LNRSGIAVIPVQFFRSENFIPKILIIIKFIPQRTFDGRTGLFKARDPETARLMRETVKISAWILGYFVAIWLLGFSAAVALTTLLYLKLAKERWLITLVLTIFAWASFYALFVYFLHVPFPEGQLFAWFG
jgi:hypothetical protein